MATPTPVLESKPGQIAAKTNRPLTPLQVADLMAGKWYVNLHTAANPGGEIRGQVMPGQ